MGEHFVIEHQGRRNVGFSSSVGTSFPINILSSGPLLWNIIVARQRPAEFSLDARGGEAAEGLSVPSPPANVARSQLNRFSLTYSFQMHYVAQMLTVELPLLQSVFAIRKS